MQSRTTIASLATLSLLAGCGGGGSGGGGNGSGSGVNRAPVVSASSHITSEIVSYEGVISASDPDGDRLTLSVSTSPIKGSLSRFDSATGAFTYTPDTGQDGADSFGVTASDGSMSSAETTISMEICHWAGTQQFGTAQEDITDNVGILRLADGSMILSGRTRGQIAADPPLGHRDAWIRKVDCRGNEVWTRQFGDANEQAIVALGLAADGQTTVALVTNYSGSFATAYRLDANGQITMAVDVDFNNHPVSYVIRGAVDGNGDMYALSRTISGDSSLVTKISGSTGTTLWHRFLEGTQDPGGSSPFFFEWGRIYVADIAFDSFDNPFIIGTYTPYATSRPCDACGFILKSDPDGTLLWTREVNTMAATCGQTRQSDLQRITIAPDHSIWIAGDNGNAGQYAHVSRFSADGTNELWTYCDVADPLRIELRARIHITNNGDGLLYGYYSSAELRFNAVLIRLDQSGNVVFRKAVESTLNGNPISVFHGSVVEDDQGLIYLTGYTAGEMTPAAPLGDVDVFFMRTDASGP